MLKIITLLGITLLGILANRQREPELTKANIEVSKIDHPLFKMTDYEY